MTAVDTKSKTQLKQPTAAPYSRLRLGNAVLYLSDHLPAAPNTPKRQPTIYPLLPGPPKWECEQVAPPNDNVKRFSKNTSPLKHRNLKEVIEQFSVIASQHWTPHPHLPPPPQPSPFSQIRRSPRPGEPVLKSRAFEKQFNPE